MKDCIATVVTTTFVPGALTMVHSFLKHNRWFDGDIVLIHDGLDAEACILFDDCFGKKVKWHLVSEEMNQSLTNLVKQSNTLSKTYKRFYSLEVFQLKQYKKILFCDSDLLFLDSIQELFKLPGSLICCGDGPVYKDEVRDAVTFEKQTVGNSTDLDYKNTFNAGFMLISSTLISINTYNDLLSFLEPSKWQKLIAAKLHDQAILNIYFSGKQHLVDCIYNYLLLHREALQKKTNIPFNQSKVLHFNGPNKPWFFEKTLAAAQDDPALIKAFELWFTAYTDMLKQLSLRTNLKQGVIN